MGSLFQGLDLYFPSLKGGGQWLLLAIPVCHEISQNKCKKYSVGGAGKFPVPRRGARYARATFAVVFPKSLRNCLIVSRGNS